MSNSTRIKEKNAYDVNENKSSTRQQRWQAHDSKRQMHEYGLIRRKIRFSLYDWRNKTCINVAV